MGPPLHQAPGSLRSTHLAFVDGLVQVGMKHLVAAFACWRGHGADSVAARACRCTARDGREPPTMTTETNVERLRITDAAAFLGVSHQRVQQLIRADRLLKPDAVDKRDRSGTGRRSRRGRVSSGGAATAGEHPARGGGRLYWVFPFTVILPVPSPQDRSRELTWMVGDLDGDVRSPPAVGGFVGSNHTDVLSTLKAAR